MNSTKLIMTVTWYLYSAGAVAQQNTPPSNPGVLPSGTALPVSVDRSRVTRSATATAPTQNLGRSAVLTDVDPMRAADTCSTPDHTPAELKALQVILMTQLASVKGDVNDFRANIPGGCQRQELVYYLKAAVTIAQMR